MNNTTFIYQRHIYTTDSLVPYFVNASSTPEVKEQDLSSVKASKESPIFNIDPDSFNQKRLNISHTYKSEVCRFCGCKTCNNCDSDVCRAIKAIITINGERVLLDSGTFIQYSMFNEKSDMKGLFAIECDEEDQWMVVFSFCGTEWDSQLASECSESGAMFIAKIPLEKETINDIELCLPKLRLVENIVCVDRIGGDFVEIECNGCVELELEVVDPKEVSDQDTIVDLPGYDTACGVTPTPTPTPMP